MQHTTSPNHLAEQICAGNRRALARAITLAETGGEPARQLMAAIYPHTGRAHLIGITGPPGAGKSSLVTALTQYWRSQNRTVGIVAVDPTSPFTGGALLGDRIRMQPLGGDPGVFVRSMASRGRLGGIARATDDAMALLDAGGFEIVIVETVGAGQSEVEIASSAQTTIVVETPGTGDDVQSIKAGVLEIADVYVVNKAEREGAEALIRQLRTMLHLAARPAEAWEPPVLAASALRNQGMPELAAALAEHRAFLESAQQQAAHNQRRAGRALTFALQELVLARALATTGETGWAHMLEQVAARQTDPYSAAQDLLRAMGAE